MNIIVRKRLAVFVLGIVFLVGAMVYSIYAQASWTEIQIEKEYDIGTEFEVPQRDVIINGKKVKATAVVTNPDGEARKDKTIELKIAGQYTITYTAKSGKKVYVDEIKFQVVSGLYNITSTSSSVTYGKYEHAENMEGLLVRLAVGDELTLNQPIDITSLDEDEWLIQAFATPDKVGSPDFARLCFRFTDSENPDIQLYMSGTGADWDLNLPHTYYVASGDGQKAKGWLNKDRLMEESGVGVAGAISRHSFGLGSELCAEYCDSQAMNLRVDFSDMKVYTNDIFVVDLDDPATFKKAWQGFPSGKAFLTVWAERYEGGSANFCLSKVGNVDLKATKVVDSEPPIITVNQEYNEIPLAVKGGTYRYIPTATAFDIYSGACEVETKVYFNYHSDNASVVEIKNGSFSTSRIGNYAIIYEAIDKAGNIGREIVWVKSVASVPEPSITLTSEPKTTWTLGELYRPKEYTYECSSGIPTFKVYATKGNKKYDLKDGYRFEKEGTYHIVYECKDVAGQTGTYEYDLKVKMGKSPVVGDIILPEYMVEDTEYTFPKTYFYDYRTGKKVKKVAKGRIIDAQGEKKLSAGDTYTLTVDENLDTVTLIYECENASYQADIPTIKAWKQENGKSRLALTNYFVRDGITVEQEAEGILFKSTRTDGRWIFGNSLLAENFKLSLQGVAKYSGFESLVVELRDYENRDHVLMIELVNGEEEVFVKVGDKLQSLGKGTTFNAENVFELQYAEGILTVNDMEIKGLNFEGFASHKLYCSMRFKGAVKDSAFRLLSINNHVMNDSKADKIAPAMAVLGTYGEPAAYKSNFVIPAIVAGDVLDPNITLSISVTYNSKPVKDVKGKVLENVDPTKEYTVCAKKYGAYNVYCSVSDYFSGKSQDFYYVVRVEDKQAPKITFSEKFVTEGKVDDIICIPNFTVSDNVTKKDKLIIIKRVFAPDGVMTAIPEDSNSVICSAPGQYEFMIMVVDEAGNPCTKTWTVKIAEK